jgi:hypothetical protein
MKVRYNVLYLVLRYNIYCTSTLEELMFKKNAKHLQLDMLGLFNSMSESMQKKAMQSEEYHFYHLIFRHIQEELFACLFSERKSRPNAPINAMVSSLILMDRSKWTYEELFKNIQFNLLTKIALGLDALEEVPFCPATLFNFQNRLNEHFVCTGENLLEQIFDQLTEEQLKTLKIKTNIQRTDSLSAASNIRNYSRLQLLVELVIRLYRILSEADTQRFAERFSDYINKTSGQYIYTLKASDIPHEFEKIGELYHWIYRHLKSTYGECDIFRVFERVFAEHFTVVDQKIEVKGSDQLSSDSAQSPDDLDATYRKKNGKEAKGQQINVTETAHPDNTVNLLTDVAVTANNVDDSRVLNGRLDRLKEKTPDLDELHTDGAYASEDNDKKCEAYKIKHVQTGVRGPEAAVAMLIDQIGEDVYQVSCPMQRVESSKTHKRYKACFDISVCQHCVHRDACPTVVAKAHQVFYFTHEDYLRNKRHRIMETIPPDRRKLRCNVEATVNEFSHRMPRGKLKVRGAFRTSVFAYSVAMAINFGRIYRYLLSGREAFNQLFSSLAYSIGELLLNINIFCRRFFNRMYSQVAT